MKAKKIFAILVWLLSAASASTAFAGGVKAKDQVPVQLVPELKQLPPAKASTPPVVTVVPPPPIVVVEKPKTCVWVRRDSATYAQGQAYSLSGMFINICGCCGQTSAWIPGTSYQYSGQVLGQTSLVEVCE